MVIYLTATELHLCTSEVLSDNSLGRPLETIERWKMDKRCENRTMILASDGISVEAKYRPGLQEFQLDCSGNTASQIGSCLLEDRSIIRALHPSLLCVRGSWARGDEHWRKDFFTTHYRYLSRIFQEYRWLRLRQKCCAHGESNSALLLIVWWKAAIITTRPYAPFAPHFWSESGDVWVYPL